MESRRAGSTHRHLPIDPDRSDSTSLRAGMRLSCRGRRPMGERWRPNPGEWRRDLARRRVSLRRRHGCSGVLLKKKRGRMSERKKTRRKERNEGRHRSALCCWLLRPRWDEARRSSLVKTINKCEDSAEHCWLNLSASQVDSMVTNE